MKLDRLLGILTMLLQNDRSRQGGFVTAPELAEKFEVNRRKKGFIKVQINMAYCCRV